MNEKEKILTHAAEQHMIEFDLEEFKKSHPQLFKTIMTAMDAYAFFQSHPISPNG